MVSKFLYCILIVLAAVSLVLFVAGCEKPLIAIVDSGKTADEENPASPAPGAGNSDPSNPGPSTPASPDPGAGNPDPSNPSPSTPASPDPGAGNPNPSNPPNPGTPPTPPPAAKNPECYVFSRGNSPGSGDDPSGGPFASVPAALTHIRTLYRGGKWPSGKSAVIVVGGTLTGSGAFGSNKAMVDISGTGNYPPIILEGDPTRQGVLDAKATAANDGRVLYIANNRVTLGSGLTLTGGHTLWGGAVLVGTNGSASEGEFIMAGGEISGNKAQNGGGVMVYKGSMTMTGGIITNNTNTDTSNVLGTGGGVYIYEDTIFTMSNGTISGNGGNKTEKGGGVLIEGHGLFTMNGGEILNNTSVQEGGGVYITGYGTFTMTNGTVSGNQSAVDGGVGKSPFGAKFIQTGGTVSGNTP